MSHSRKELFLLLIFFIYQFRAQSKCWQLHMCCSVINTTSPYFLVEAISYNFCFDCRIILYTTFRYSCVQHLHYSKIAASSFKLFPSKALKSHASGILSDTLFVASCTAEVKTRMGKAEVAVETRIPSPSNTLSPSSAWLVQSFSVWLRKPC